MDLNLMDPKVIVLVAAVVILIIAVFAWLYVRKRRSTTADLRQKFGPEYDRAVDILVTDPMDCGCLSWNSDLGIDACLKLQLLPVGCHLKHTDLYKAI